MARQITFSVPDEIYEAIQGYMKDEGLPFVAPFIRNQICALIEMALSKALKMRS